MFRQSLRPFDPAARRDFKPRQWEMVWPEPDRRIQPVARARLHPALAIFLLIRELEPVVVGAPLAVFGAATHILPYEIVHWIARRDSTRPGQGNSRLDYVSAAIVLASWLVQVIAAWMLAPPLWAAMYTLALPYSGYYARQYADRLPTALRRLAILAGTFGGASLALRRSFVPLVHELCRSQVPGFAGADRRRPDIAGVHVQ